eukprot:4990030-Ditylum_brightwellii.AAC.1
MKLLKEYNIDIFGFTEMTLAWSKTLDHTAKYHRQKLFQQFSLTKSSSNDSTRTTHQQGGVCMGITDAMT